MPISEARKNDEVISLADSQVLRWIDELNGITDAEQKARDIKAEIKRLRNEQNSVQNRKAVKQLYAQLDAIQFKPDYMCLIIDKEKDYYRACKGFSINGISYKRLLGTNGGIKNSTIVWVLGIVILFAGTYLSYSADGISFWSESVVSNTTILGCSMMFYMFFLSIALVHLLKGTRKIGAITVALLGLVNAVLLALPILTDILFYDTWLYWAAAQVLTNIILLGCLLREFFVTKGKEHWLYLGSILPLISFGVDVIMTDLGVWKGGLSSKYVFVIFFVAAMRRVNLDRIFS